MDWISIAALTIAIAVAIYLFVSRQTPPTAANLTTAINAVPSLATELETVATTIVQANEQRKREGKLTNEQAYSDALNYVRGWFPVKVGITNEQIVAAINSAILIASVATAQIEQSKEIVQDAGAPDKPLHLGR